MIERETASVTDRDLVEAGEAPLLRRLAAEFVGTLLLVAIGSGAAVVLTLRPLQALERLIEGAGGPEAVPPGQQSLFGELLGNTLGDVLGVALAFGLTLAVLIYALGGVSGAHFNPAVSVALALARRFSWKDVGPYVAVQMLGGIAGAFVIAGIYGENGVRFGDSEILLGATRLGEGIGNWQGVLAEAAIAFILVLAIMAIAVDPRAPKGWSGLVIGIALAAGILFTGAASGGSANFARTIGPLFVSWFPALSYDASVEWGDYWLYVVYLVGPLVGAAAAALLYESITGLEQAAPAPGPGAATPAPGGDTLLGGFGDPTDPRPGLTDPHAGPGGGDDTPNPPPGPYKGPR